MKTNQYGFAHLGLAALGLVIFIAGALAYVYIRNVDGGDGAACKTAGDGLRVCVSSSKSSLSSSETTEIKTLVTNTTFSDISQGFSCTFTGPTILVNEEDVTGPVLCGAAMTSKNIRAQATETFIDTLSGSQLRTGTNTIKSQWGSYESGDVKVEKSADSAGEIAAQFKTCQTLEDNIDHESIPDYCAAVSVQLKDVDGKEYICEDWRRIIAKVRLSLPCDSLMDMGIAYVYVPRADVDRYVADIEALPEVESAMGY